MKNKVSVLPGECILWREYSQGIQDIKSIIINRSSVTGMFREGIYYLLSGKNTSFSLGIIFVLTDILLLVVISVLLVISAFRKWSENWYEKWSLIGILAYFWVVSGAPVGMGAYPRLRLSFLFLLFLGAVVTLDKRKEIQK